MVSPETSLIQLLLNLLAPDMIVYINKTMSTMSRSK